MICKTHSNQNDRKSVVQQAFFLKMIWVEVNGRDGKDQEFRLVLHPLGSEQHMCFESIDDLSSHLQTQEPYAI